MSIRTIQLLQTLCQLIKWNIQSGLADRKSLIYNLLIIHQVRLLQQDNNNCLYLVMPN